MSNAVDVSVIIVSYNTRDLTLRCLKSLYENTKDVSFEVIVVDNASSDGSAEAIADMFQDVVLIKNDKNLGFGRANNIAMRRAKGKYFFLLNSDTVIKNNALKIFYDFMERNTHVGAVGTWLRDEKGNIIHSYGDFPNLKWQISEVIRDGLLWTLEIFFLRWIRDFIRVIKKFFRRNAFFDGDETKNHYLDSRDQFYPVCYITGADLFVRREVIEKVGDFDPRFFLYFEETDLEYRMAKEGIILGIIKGPYIVHLEGKSSSKSSLRSYTLSKVSALKFYWKHYGIISTSILWIVYLFIGFWFLINDIFIRKYPMKEVFLFILSIATVKYSWFIPHVKEFENA